MVSNCSGTEGKFWHKYEYDENSGKYVFVVHSNINNKEIAKGDFDSLEQLQEVIELIFSSVEQEQRTSVNFNYESEYDDEAEQFRFRVSTRHDHVIVADGVFDDVQQMKDMMNSIYPPPKRHVDIHGQLSVLI